jgi:hypothetical protein
MKIDQTTIRWLNLLHSSPTFVIRYGSNNEVPTVECLKLIPRNDGEYCLSGTTILKNGLEIPSVFRINTNTGGTLNDVYWLINNNWRDFNNRPSVFEELGVVEHDIFPFDWTYAVDLEEDIYHS